MAQYLELDSGTIYRDVPDGVSEEELIQRLEKDLEVVPDNILGLLKPQIEEKKENQLQDLMFFEEDPDTWADWVNTGFEIGPALAAGSAGVQRGASLASQIPVPHPLLKGIITGVGGVIGGASATVPLVFAGKYVGENVEALIEGREYDPKAAFSAALDAAQTDAIAQAVFGTTFPIITRSAGALKNKLTGKINLSPEQVKRVIKLQRHLKEYGTSLLPSQIAPDSWFAKFTTDLAAVSELTQVTVDRYLKSYHDYMGNQINRLILDYKGASDSPTGQGKVLQTLIGQTDQALSALVSPIYRSIKEKSPNVVIKAKDKATEAANELKELRRGEVVNSKTGETEITAEFLGKEKQAVNYLDSLPSELDFWEAHQRLSAVKKQINDINVSTNKDTNAADAWGRVKTILEESMEEASTKLSPDLQKEYKKVTKMYREGKKVVSKEYFEQALKVLEPSKIGAMLTQPGYVEGLKDVKELTDLARQYYKDLPKDSEFRKDLNILDPLQEIRKGYLQQSLKFATDEGTQTSLQQFRKNLSDTKFRETFDALFAGTATSKKIDNLLEELAILERGGTMGGAGFSLAIRSGELSPIHNPSIFNIIKGFIPGTLSKKAISEETVNKMINNIKIVSYYESRGLKVPSKIEQKMIKEMTLSGKAGLITGGAAFEERPMPTNLKASPSSLEGMLTGR
tara:strand:+ start:1257 stop:3311 length:2055 start_codon:yes stop_codon:yes gene_type:complete